MGPLSIRHGTVQHVIARTQNETRWVARFWREHFCRTWREDLCHFTHQFVSCSFLFRAMENSPTSAAELDSDGPQGSKNVFCASRRIFRVEPGCHFSGRIFFHLGRNRAPRLKSFGAKKKEAIFEASFCTHLNTNIINETVASSLFFLKELGPTSFSWNPERKG